jgi:hypothetical protein
MKVYLIKVSLFCSCPKSCTFHKYFVGPKIVTEALLLKKLKLDLKKNFVSRWFVCVENPKPHIYKEPGTSWGAKQYIIKYRSY